MATTLASIVHVSFILKGKSKTTMLIAALAEVRILVLFTPLQYLNSYAFIGLRGADGREPPCRHEHHIPPELYALPHFSEDIPRVKL